MIQFPSSTGVSATSPGPTSSDQQRPQRADVHECLSIASSHKGYSLEASPSTASGSQSAMRTEKVPAQGQTDWLVSLQAMVPPCPSL
jgi:hypothetical protein